MLTRLSRPSTPRTPGRSTPGSESRTYYTAHETASSADEEAGFATPLSSTPLPISSYPSPRAQQDSIRQWITSQMGSSQSTPKPEDGLARDPSPSQHDFTEVQSEDSSPEMHTRSSTAPLAPSSTTSAPSTKRARATRHTVQSTVHYPDLTPLKEQEDADSIETPRQSTSPSAVRQDITSASPKRSPPTAVVVIPTTVPDLTASLRGRGLDKQANALEALQEQARKDPGSATLLEALLAGRKLTGRMNRDWQRYVDDVDIVKKPGKSDGVARKEGTDKKAAKRKRAAEDDDESDMETVQQPMKQLKVDDSQEDLMEDSVAIDTTTRDPAAPSNRNQAVILTEQEKRQRKKEKNKRRHPHPPKNNSNNADRPNRIVLDVGDIPVVLKRRKHKGSRGLGRRKKAVLARKQQRLEQEQAKEAQLS